LFQVALKLAKITENEKMLRLLLKDVEDAYEYIIIDAPSSYGFLSVAAMTAADWLLVCMSVPDNSMEDFHAFLRMVKYIRTTHHIPLKIAGIIFNRCDTKEEILSFIENQNLSDIKEMVYDTFIPRDESVQRSIELKIPVALQNIKSPAAEAYLRFAKELHFFFNKRGVL
jgi:chromosome partitioning protein